MRHRHWGSVLGALLAAGLLAGKAWAFDIPTPQNTPQSKTDFFSAPKSFAPIVPLPAIDSAAPNDTGAGHLPSGVSVTTTVHLPPEGALQRAPILVTMVWLDREKTVAHFRLHRPSGAHFASRRIRAGQEIRIIDGRQVIAHTYQWALTPLAAGALTLDFAPMRFTAVGEPDTRYEYQPVSRVLQVRPIPGYWPESLPVSPPPQIHAEPLPPLTAGQPVTWLLRITGRGWTEYTLQHLLDEQLLGSPVLGIGQAEIRRATDTPVPADDPLAETFTVRIPLLPAPHGGNATQATLPTLRLPYLDPRDNPAGHTLHAVTLPGQTLHWQPTASARWHQALVYWWWRGLLLLALIVTAGFALRDLARRHAARRRHHRAKEQLAQCPDADCLWHTLHRLTGCQSTAELIARAPNPWFRTALHALDQARYATPPPPPDRFESLRSELVRWLPAALFPSTAPQR